MHSGVHLFADDISWFKPVELRTKHSRRGHIKEPLGQSLFYGTLALLIMQSSLCFGLFNLKLIQLFLPAGTHGHMKCVFDGQLNSQDTVLLNLYKRVFPKWTFKEEGENVSFQTCRETEDGAMEEDGFRTNHKHCQDTEMTDNGMEH